MYATQMSLFFGASSTYVRIGLDLCEGVLVKLSCVTLEGVDAVCVLNTNSVALGETALMHSIDPAHLSFNFSLWLEGNNVFSLNDVALLGDRSSECSGEQSSDC